MEERGWVLRLHLFWASPLARDSHLPQKNYTCFAGYLNYNKKKLVLHVFLIITNIHVAISL